MRSGHTLPEWMYIKDVLAITVLKGIADAKSGGAPVRLDNVHRGLDRVRQEAAGFGQGWPSL